jgi:hypothetical protein
MLGCIPKAIYHLQSQRLIAVKKFDSAVEPCSDAFGKPYSLPFSGLSNPATFMQDAGFQEHLERMVHKDQNCTCAS